MSKDQNPELAPNPKIMSQNQNPELAQNHIFRWIFDQILYFSSIIIKILARISSVNKKYCHIYYIIFVFRNAAASLYGEHVPL